MQVNMFDNDIKIPLQPAQDSNESLMNLIRRLEGNRLSIPDHQRQPDSWDKRKKASFIKRIQDNRRSVGCLITYQLIEGNGVVYLNDGLQRATTVLEYFHDPERHGDTLEQAMARLETYNVTVQHRHYSSHDDALADFQEVNQGSSLTAYEFCHGVLTYMTLYSFHWERFFEDLHSHLSMESNKIIAKQRGDRKKTQLHVYRRNNLALFYRFATGNKDLTRYWSGSKEVRTSEVRNKEVIEWKMREWCESTGIQDAKKVLETFKEFVTRETGLIEDLWRKQEHDINKGIAMALYRTLLDVAIWKRNNKKPYDQWESFVINMLKFSGGGGQVVNPKDLRRRGRCAMDSLNSLKTLCSVVESDLYEGKVYRNTKMKGIRPGRDISHVEPISLFGDGPVIAETASRNRSRGAQTMI